MAKFTLFTWDEAKARINEGKHGIGFDEASSAFLDDHALFLSDPDCHDGQRFLLLAMSASIRVLVVCYCYVEVEHVVRIISARKASSGEIARYYRHQRLRQ